MLPPPLMVLDVPLRVILPLLAKKDPATFVLPLIVNVLVVVIVPETVRSSRMMPVPVMVLVAVPLMVSVPPVCVNVPDPVVERLPDRVRAADDELILEAFTTRLLKVCVADPEMVVPGPFILTVLVPAVNVPLLTQLPETAWVKLPPLNIVAKPMVSLPLIVILAPALKVTPVPDPVLKVKLPAMVKAVTLAVLVTAPKELLKLRLP